MKKGDFKRTSAEIDPGIIKTVLDVLSVGAGRDSAAAVAGISRETLNVYVQWGRRYHEALERGDTFECEREAERARFFASFHVDREKAEHGLKAYCLKLICEAGKDDWRALSWILEKMYPLEFRNPPTQLEVTHSEKLPTSKQEARARILRLVAKIETDEPEGEEVA